ncbi:MAG: endonuclease/exonuclease/phosphatase family protein [Lewinellaceae bacterium]|nr:endonuclease/exonuclease/phosphatase family protein [Phaeodactylibacter sp.]MCB0613556.1 endonuclease/exonuclease/phosphatase family protein [Phaeodactylibacter sp.]MCB9349715.1 endonuclease/exonuclease/phosphatase family protein [Lewinellaceae bacterium]
MHLKTLFLSSLLLLCLQAGAQQQYKVGAIGFYNFENLFDTLDAPDVRDEEFTPAGRNVWDTQKYLEKLQNLSRVVSELATDITPDGVSILGVAEVENRKVLEDFVQQPLVKGRNYQIVHHDSPDERGIDVALLYNPKYFKVLGAKAMPLLIYRDNGERDFTRDVLLVSGLYDGEPLHIMVNHWPSRSGGEAASQPFRNAAAMICKAAADSLMQEDPNAKVLIMGDLNDDPISPSVKTILNAQRKKEAVRKGGLYNPMYNLFKKGIGTLAYRDAWSLFDQILLSYGLVNGKTEGYQFYKVFIYNEPYLLQSSGQFAGYPFRSFGGGAYMGGYSDHFAVYVALVKAVE